MAIAELGAALAAGKQALEVARLIYDAKDSFKDAAVQMQMADLMIKLADTNLALSKLEHQIWEKDVEIAGMKKQADVESRLRYIAPSYWLGMLDGTRDDGPYCQKCWDANRKLIRQQKHGDKYSPALICAECETTTDDPSRTAQPFPQPPRSSWDR